MQISQSLLNSVCNFLKDKPAGENSYIWKVHKTTWERLGDGFDPHQYATGEEQNVALKAFLSRRWLDAKPTEKRRIAEWMIRDWGGIRRNSDSRIKSYVLLADEAEPETPLEGVSSYSKVLSIRNPEKYAIYDSRVAASLNALQLMDQQSLGLKQAVAFSCPASQNKKIREFSKQFSRRSLVHVYGFKPIHRSDTYRYFTTLLSELKQMTGASVLEIEMRLFADAERLCEAARNRVAPMTGG
ncbi:hypothetical protein HNQ36_005325 [Afipia massiliensis]|uniref:Uncharacterized protein n=1 Tax=Afipia massiliensis TaxID=211460 RepID=A0A840N9U1_9BRAD|nr:hypothetical protein [Afipia massiliensis]MBB5055314.1 hypothetical protein [Afipia massiliensis]